MIELAVLRSREKEIKEGNISEVWKATIEAQSGGYTAYIKHIDLYGIYTESVCAMAGRELGLDIPKPFIVLDGETLMFGCEDTGYDSFKQYVYRNDKAVEKALFKWLGINQATIFDEWIGNADRNRGNLLYCGDGSFTLIDHGLAFGEGWYKNKPLLASKNQLSNIIAWQGDLTKQKLRKDALNESTKYQGLNTSDICNHQTVSTLLPRQNINDVINFLMCNSKNLVKLINDRTGRPSLI